MRGAGGVVLGEQPQGHAGRALVGEEPAEPFKHCAQARVGDILGLPVHAGGVVAERRTQDLLHVGGHHRDNRLAAGEALALVGHRPGAQALGL